MSENFGKSKRFRGCYQENSIKGIQQGLDDFEADWVRSFHEFAEEQCRKYNLPADS